MDNRPSRRPQPGRWLAMALVTTALLAGTASAGDPEDDILRAQERAERDAERATERADRDEARFIEDRARIQEDAASDPERAARDEARLEEDRAEELAEQQEEAADDLEDYLDDLADAQEDLADDLADAQDYGSSTEMQDLASTEDPEFDRRGYPVRRGEVVGLDLAEGQLAEASRQGFRVISREPLPSLQSEFVRLSVPEGMDVGAALELARSIAPGATLDLVHYYGMQITPSGAFGAQDAGVLPRREGRLTIGMIDTGIVGHSALGETSVELRDFSDGEGGVPTAHGTAIASILASEGSSTIYAANIFRGSAERPHTSADALVRALEWMAGNDVPVINMSLSGPRNSVLDRLVQRTISGGTVIVAAAGNGGPTAPPAYPAALRNVVAVTAVDRNNRVYRYANQGDYISVAARGVNEPAARVGGGIARYSGTSYATPHIAAWMARCMDGSAVSTCVASLRREARDLGEPGFRSCLWAWSGRIAGIFTARGNKSVFVTVVGPGSSLAAEGTRR